MHREPPEADLEALHELILLRALGEPPCEPIEAHVHDGRLPPRRLRPVPIFVLFFRGRFGEVGAILLRPRVPQFFLQGRLDRARLVEREDGPRVPPGDSHIVQAAVQLVPVLQRGQRREAHCPPHLHKGHNLLGLLDLALCPGLARPRECAALEYPGFHLPLALHGELGAVPHRRRVPPHDAVHRLRHLDRPRLGVLAHARCRHDRVAEYAVELAGPPQDPRGECAKVGARLEHEGLAASLPRARGDVPVAHLHQLQREVADLDAVEAVRLLVVIAGVPRQHVGRHDHIVLPHVLDLEATVLTHEVVEDRIDLIHLLEEVLRVEALHRLPVKGAEEHRDAMEMLEEGHGEVLVKQPGGDEF
mmetsp:Transcript_21532/g.54298  ORF Transcript_21532/g.54298 Transcript_21532/m.54298 type:complete len:361 (-) Transcript_21532:1061-2143(-)